MTVRGVTSETLINIPTGFLTISTCFSDVCDERGELNPFIHSFINWLLLMGVEIFANNDNDQFFAPRLPHMEDLNDQAMTRQTTCYT